MLVDNEIAIKEEREEVSPCCLFSVYRHGISYALVAVISLPSPQQTISDASSSGRHLASTDTSVNSSVSIQVSTNNPPISGKLSVSPSSGYALNTSFMISTDMWVDTDLPLSYTFSFLSSTSGGASNVYLSLKTNSAMNRITAILASANGVAMMGTNVSMPITQAVVGVIPVVVGVGNIAMPVHYVRMQ
eukprot:scaffold4365_cov137-Ochromonas_danica.AAC.2